MTRTRCRADGAEVTLRSKTVVLDFTGECDGTAAAGLRLVAELPDAGGAEDGGTVVLEQDTATVTQPGGEIRLAAREPLRCDGEPVDVEFVLPESPESTVLVVRGLAVRLEPADG
ncbi:hypothetical protein [Lentzea flava]|uniref:Uncharacterized protein n=1 Tax=Lentzea flava TaxID=103732 RepID=A0ABQ2UA78_9PSEU|nr:hypothetical protein [Lentzea flava]MCP2196718.1 hypothetical protein [Lentzea flava]GGU15996.1 hypothetical protein GCM10010178_04530 [Lentzea flava]